MDWEKPFRKKPIRKIQKTVKIRPFLKKKNQNKKLRNNQKINVKMPHVNKKKPLARNEKLIQTKN